MSDDTLQDWKMKRICPVYHADAEPDAFELGGYRIYACSQCDPQRHCEYHESFATTEGSGD